MFTPPPHGATTLLSGGEEKWLFFRTLSLRGGRRPTRQSSNPCNWLTWIASCLRYSQGWLQCGEEITGLLFYLDYSTLTCNAPDNASGVIAHLHGVAFGSVSQCLTLDTDGKS